MSVPLRPAGPLPALRAFHLACAQPWAITAPALQLILQIAARENLSLEAVEARLGRPLDNTSAVTVRDGVATIPIEGPIFRRADMFTRISGATAIETLAQDLQTALADPQIAAIVLAVDSPGGEVNGVAEFSDMVYAARKTKPIVAYVSDLGASAAYWIASAAQQVVVASTAAVGSIGVVAAVPDPAATTSRTIAFVSSQSPDKRPDPTTERGRSQLQDHIDSLADVFVASVARNRAVSPDVVLRDFGQGGLFVGQAAVDAGLADAVGSYEGVLAQQIHSARARMARGHLVHADSPQGGAMSFKDAVARWFGAGMPHDFDPTAAETLPASGGPAAAEEVAAPPSERELALAAELEAAQAAAAAERTVRRSADALRFADAEVLAGRALPADRGTLLLLYTQAAQDDAAHPVAAGQSPRVALLAQTAAARPAHDLTTERIADAATVAVLETQQTTPVDADGRPYTKDELARIVAAARGS